MTNIVSSNCNELECAVKVNGVTYLISYSVNPYKKVCCITGLLRQEYMNGTLIFMPISVEHHKELGIINNFNFKTDKDIGYILADTNIYPILSI